MQQPNMPGQYQQPAYQSPVIQPFLEYKNAALWCIILAWVLGVVGWMLSLTIIGAVLGIPMIACGLVLHVIGIVFIAMIRVR
jgi:hypothetical protein